MKTRYRCTLLGAACAVLTVPGAALAFSEDLCTAKDEGGKTHIENCMSSAACQSGDGSACYATVVWKAGTATLKEARSMIHVDATYFIALGLGFKRDVAYWLAAYNEVTDIGQYAPFDRCGSTVTDPLYQTILIDGFMRTKTKVGGSMYHFVTAHSPAGDGGDLDAISGLFPWRSEVATDQFSSTYSVEYDKEGLLAHLRRWTLAGAGASPVMCTAGFTAQSGTSMFNGSTCYAKSSGAPVSVVVTGLSAVPLSFSTGPQILQIDAAQDYRSLKDLLDRGTGRLWSVDGQMSTPVAGEIAAEGIYLHTLADRVSHSYCTDHGQSSLVTTGPGAPRVRFDHDTDYCGTGEHAYQHYIEVGQKTLSVKTYSALGYVHDELTAFAEKTRASHPEWFAAPAPLYTKAELIGTRGTSPYYSAADVYKPGLVTTPLTVEAGHARLAAMNNAVQAAMRKAFPSDTSDFRMPGNGPAASCP